MTIAPRSEPTPASERPAKRRTHIPHEHWSETVLTVVESVGVAIRRCNRHGMITTFLGLLLFGAASFRLLVPGVDHSSGPEAFSPPDSLDASWMSSGAGPSGSAQASVDSGSAAADTGPSGVAMPRGDVPGWHQTYADDFTGAHLADRWNLYSGQPGGDPLGWWNPSHVTADGGVLTVAGRRESTPNGDLYVTGGLSNAKTFSQTYGRFAVRFRMDKGYGLAYALLLWPTNNEWPPEIDILEDNAKNRDMASATLHYGPNNTQVHRETTGDFSVWHTAELDWTTGRLVYRIDGTVWATMTTTNVPDIPMSIAIQTQAWKCGGSWEGCPTSSTPAKVNFYVDWVVAYSKA